MPNWCYNHMTVMGGKRELRRLVRAMTEEGEGKIKTVGLNHLVPLDPRASVEQTFTNTNADGEEVVTKFSSFADKERDGFDGYDHALEMWGSKWGACEVWLKDKPEDITNSLGISYDSAWGPCDALIINISKQFPNLVFAVSSTEESQAFALWVVIANGEIVESQEYAVKMPPDIAELYDRANDGGEDNETELLEEYYERSSEWYNDLGDRAMTDAEVCASEYIKHIAYIKRCERKGVTPRPFIPSI